ncbi:MAG TPA: hypothetical protein PK157_21170 [Bryobacteraceae bacterium]|nr:hypothetical protein [Bryobacteraceae bacterium]
MRNPIAHRGGRHYATRQQGNYHHRTHHSEPNPNQPACFALVVSAEPYHRLPLYGFPSCPPFSRSGYHSVFHYVDLTSAVLHLAAAKVTLQPMR